jgi:hypothetical protein
MTTKVTKTQDNTTLWIEYSQSDRNIVIITRSGMITGVNFWQGIGEDMFSDFNRADERLTRYVMPSVFARFDTECILPHPDYDDMIEFIDNLIWDYVDRQSKTIAIPSIGQWLYGCKLYPMERSENGLIEPCNYDDGESVHIDEISEWPFDEISQQDINRMERTDNDVVSKYIYDRISQLISSRGKSTPVEKPSKTYTIPSEQKQLIRIALEYYRKTMQEVISFKSDADEFDIYDLRQLTGLMYGDVDITLSAEDLENFTSRHNVDPPNY